MPTCRLALLACAVAAVATPPAAQAWMLESHEIPLEIDTYGRFAQNRSIFMWTPFDSLRTHWDLTRYQTGYVARVGLRDYGEGRYPAPDSMEDDPPDPEICEMDTMGSGQEQWIYLYKDDYGLYIDGIDYSQQGFRFIGNYRPDQPVYNTPMYRGSSWMSQIQWLYEVLPGIFIVFTEQHQKRVVAQGKVKVPMSGEYYWPCLVIRDYMDFRDNAGGTPQLRWIYEWVVPGHFLGANGVGAAMSQNGAGPDFINVEQLFQLQSCSIPDWDLIPPEFANTTVWTDTGFAGPFVVSSEITDDDDVGAESLYYRVDQGAWAGVGSDSSSGDTYWFTIPEVTTACRIDYYVWAKDDYCEYEEIDFWTTWPVCSPESTMITFHALMTGTRERPGPDLSRLTVSPNPFSSNVSFSLGPPGSGPAEVRLYSSTGGFVRTLGLGPGEATATWDGRDIAGRKLPAGAYFYRVESSGRARTGKVMLER